MKNAILIVNDDAELRAEMERILKAEGFYFWSAASGSEALSHAKGYDFALAILDLHLGDMDAVAFYDALMQQESHYELPVVMPLNTLDGKEIAALNELCARATLTILSKPLDPKRLLALAERYGVRKGLD